MPAQQLVASTRYIDRGNTRIYWIVSIASPDLIPTRLEMDGGIDLSREVNDLSGWTVASNTFTDLNLGSLFQNKIPGATYVEDSTLTLYTSRNGTDVRSFLARGISGHVMFCDGGDITGHKAEVYPVTVASVGLNRTVPGTEPSKITVGFAITKQPAQYITIPSGGSGGIGALYPSLTLYPSTTLYPSAG